MKVKLSPNIKRVIASFLLMMVLASSADFVTLYSYANTLIENKTICGFEEHIHIDECYQNNLICNLNTTKPHEHLENCYEDQLICENADETHTHIEECYQKNTICTNTEDIVHTHDDNCYEKNLTCNKEEHSHVETCYEDETQEEVDLEEKEDNTVVENEETNTTNTNTVNTNTISNTVENKVDNTVSNTVTNTVTNTTNTVSKNAMMKAADTRSLNEKATLEYNGKYYKVEIESFIRGAVSDIRASELMQARIYVSDSANGPWTVTNYVGDTLVSKLQYQYETKFSGGRTDGIPSWNIMYLQHI